MDERLTRQIQGSSGTSKEEIETGLVETLVEVGGDPLTVRGARDTLSAVLGKVKKGSVQLIGRRKDEMTVMISLKDLVDLVSVAMRPQTFGEALDAMGFEPLGRRIVVARGRNRRPLKRYREIDDLKSDLTM
ncbi:hypothetical protein ACFSQQ_11100 [Mesorhizobium kowhaii]|uniref:hypothetical protein n=1 Tax=Mesorhizobium kowhaii TaxID=1300272 RepID=UPI0035EDC922